jgi:hypothetical protein
MDRSFRFEMDRERMYIDIADAMQRDAVTTDETDYSKVSMYRPKQRKAPSLLDTAQHSIPSNRNKNQSKNSEGGYLYAA